MSIQIHEGQAARDAVFTGCEPMHQPVQRFVTFRHVDSAPPPHNQTLLVAVCEHSRELWDYDAVFEGWYDGEVWFDAAGDQIVDGAVTHWAAKPHAPQ